MVSKKPLVDSSLNKNIKELLIDEIKMSETEREDDKKFRRQIIISVVLIASVIFTLILFSIGLNYFAGTVEIEPTVEIIE